MCCKDRKKFYDNQARENKSFKDAPDQLDLRMQVWYNKRRHLLSMPSTKPQLFMLSMHSVVDLASLLDITGTAKMAHQATGHWKIVFLEGAIVTREGNNILITLGRKAVTITVPNSLLLSEEGIYPPGKALNGQFK